MTLAIIELNDSEIRVSIDDRIVLREPGVAVLKPDRIRTGTEAMAIARHHPRETASRFWSQLGEDSLVIPSRLARHHADLAYHQLLDIHRRAGQPDEVIFAVPGHYSREQLSLLLGIVEACPFRAVGIVDAAVASGSTFENEGTTHHLEMHLHNVLVTTLASGQHAERRSVSIIDQTGLASIYDACAEYITGLFIDQTRFDPTHHAETEQSLYDMIPGLLQTLGTAEEAAVEFVYRDKHYQTRIPAEGLLSRLGQHYERIYHEIAAVGTPLIGDRLASLPGFTDRLPESLTLDEEAVFTGCRLHIEHIRRDDGPVNFVTRLPVTPALKKAITTRDDASPAGERLHETSTGSTRPDHLLLNAHAWPLDQRPLYLQAGNVAGRNSTAHDLCNIRLVGQDILVSPTGELPVFLNGKKLTQPCPVTVGDTLMLAGTDLAARFIHVLET